MGGGVGASPSPPLSLSPIAFFFLGRRVGKTGGDRETEGGRDAHVIHSALARGNGTYGWWTRDGRTGFQGVLGGRRSRNNKREPEAKFEISF